MNKKRKVRLTKRDYAILRDAQEYGLIVPEFLHAQRFAGKERDAVKSTLRRLYGRPPHHLYLRPEPLDDKRVYYRLTSKGCRLIGASRDSARPFGRFAVAQRYAIVWFILVDRPGKRQLFEPTRFPDQFGNLRGRLPKRRFFLEEGTDSAMRVGYFLVDLRTDVRRLVRQSWQGLGRFLERGWFNKHLLTRRFVFRVLTYDEQKAGELDKLLRTTLRRRLGKPFLAIGVRGPADEVVDLQVLLVPGMDQLIPHEGRGR